MSNASSQRQCRPASSDSLYLVVSNVPLKTFSFVMSCRDSRSIVYSTYAPIHPVRIRTTASRTVDISGYETCWDTIWVWDLPSHGTGSVYRDECTVCDLG